MPRPRIGPENLTAAERQRRARAKRAGAVTLTPAAAADIDRIKLPDETKAATVARALRIAPGAR